MGERDCVEEGILIYVVIWFSLESPLGLEKGTVCFIFVWPAGLLRAGVRAFKEFKGQFKELLSGLFLLAPDSNSLNTVAFSPAFLQEEFASIA